MTFSKRNTLIIASIPFVIAVLIMLPRLISAQFGFLDDGFILNEVREILSGDLSMRLDIEVGRFRPIYWLYFTVIYAIAGPNAFWFYCGHLIILLFILLEVRFLMKQYYANEWQILLTSILFLFSIPIIENFFTLSKGETGQMVFLLAALLSLGRLKKTRQKQTPWRLALFTFLSILAAFWAKETSYILVPLAILWMTYAVINRKNFPLSEFRAYFIFLCAALTAIVTNFAISSIWGAYWATGGGYTSKYDFAISTFILRTPRWLTLYAFYFHYLLPLLIIAVLLLFTKEKGNKHLRHNLFHWGGWICAWAAGFIPWEFAETYYLFPFSLGAPIIAGLLLPYIIKLLKMEETCIKSILWSVIILFITLFLATLTQYHTHALAQLTIDFMNHQMLEKTRALLGEEDQVIMGVNTSNEYVQNFGRLINDQDSGINITVEYVSLEVLLGLNSRTDVLLLLPFIQHQPALLVRTGVEEEFTMAWVDEIRQTTQGQLQGLAYSRTGFQINNLNLPVIFCPILRNRGFCETPDPLFDTRKFYYGWDIYEIR